MFMFIVGIFHLTTGIGITLDLGEETPQRYFVCILQVSQSYPNSSGVNCDQSFDLWRVKLIQIKWGIIFHPCFDCGSSLTWLCSCNNQSSHDLTGEDFGHRIGMLGRVKHRWRERERSIIWSLSSPIYTYIYNSVGRVSISMGKLHHTCSHPPNFFSNPAIQAGWQTKRLLILDIGIEKAVRLDMLLSVGQISLYICLDNCHLIL